MEVKHKNIHLVLDIAKKTPDLAVCLSIPFKASPYSLKKLVCNNPSAEPELQPKSEEAALAFAVYECVRDQFIATPLEATKSKVSRMSCKVLNGQLNIYWNTQGTGSALRKTLSLAFKCLNPSKMFAKYSENMKFLGGKANREHFNYCVKLMNEGIKKEICIAAVGKINTNEAKLKEIVEAAVVKLPALEMPSAKETSAPEKRDCSAKEFPSVKVADAASCIVVADYIRSNSNGMNVESHDGIVEIYNDNWESMHNKIKDANRINNFCKSKYEKLGDAFVQLLAYHSLVNQFADASSVGKLLKSKVKAVDAKALIKKAL